MWGVLIVIARSKEELHTHNEELQASWHLSSRRREIGEASETHAVLDVERRGFQALFSGAHQRASRNGPSHDEARPWWGVSPWLIWRLYVYYDTRGRNTSSSLLANRSEKSVAKPSRSRGAPHRVHERKSGEKRVRSLFERKIVPPFLSSFLSFFLSFLSSLPGVSIKNVAQAWNVNVVYGSASSISRLYGAYLGVPEITSVQDDCSRVVPLRHPLVPRGEQPGFPQRSHTRYEFLAKFHDALSRDDVSRNRRNERDSLYKFFPTGRYVTFDEFTRSW